MGDHAKSLQEEQQVVEIRAKHLVIDDAVIESRQKGVPIPEVWTKAEPFHHTHTSQSACPLQWSGLTFLHPFHAHRCDLRFMGFA